MTVAVPPPDIARTLAETFSERAAGYDRTGAFPHDSIADLREAGLLALTVPRRLGGGGAGLVRAIEVVGVVGRGDPATALILSMQCLQHALIHRLDSAWPRRVADKVAEEAIATGALINALRVEPELGTPSRGGLPATVARRDGDGWRVSGRKLGIAQAAEQRHGAERSGTDGAPLILGGEVDAAALGEHHGAAVHPVDAARHIDEGQEA